jgi:hypothetical protein
MFDIHQSQQYAQYMRAIGWKVETLDGVAVFIKPIPLLGAIAKIQRADKIPNDEKLRQLKQRYHIRSITFEPSLTCTVPENYLLASAPFLPTKTIHIDLTLSETDLFKNLTEAKQRAVRRAAKAGIVVKQSTDIDAFIHLKNKSAGLLGFMTTKTLPPLWQTFSPDHASLLLACNNNESSPPIAGIFLLFQNKTAYYWIAGANSLGKKLFAPTLLAWEAQKLAKAKGCTVFDFEGVYDERYPNLNKNWLGFTKFKEGFGGKVVYFPKPIIL